MTEETKLPPTEVLEVEIMPARVCPYCKVVSNFDVAAHTVVSGTRPPQGKGHVDNERLSLERCQHCGAAMYVWANSTGTEIVDLYPKNIETAPSELPSDVGKAFQEALLCYGAGAPNGSLLMCRRALQEVMKDKQAKKGDLPAQLNDLVQKGIIIPRLRDWADQARIGGKIAAHGDGGSEWGDPDKVWGTIEDAQTVIEYLKGFFEFLYVLDARMKARFGEPSTPPAS